jgi:hypothetical protein
MGSFVFESYRPSSSGTGKAEQFEAHAIVDFDFSGASGEFRVNLAQMVTFSPLVVLVARVVLFLGLPVAGCVLRGPLDGCTSNHCWPAPNYVVDTTPNGCNEQRVETPPRPVSVCKKECLGPSCPPSQPHRHNVDSSP